MLEKKLIETAAIVFNNNICWHSVLFLRLRVSRHFIKQVVMLWDRHVIYVVHVSGWMSNLSTLNSLIFSFSLSLSLSLSHHSRRRAVAASNDTSCNPTRYTKFCSSTVSQRDAVIADITSQLDRKHYPVKSRAAIMEALRGCFGECGTCLDGILI